ncbi:hypothetical protein BS78_03G191200 [Paspalum vaginatum]|nr:hypothetical protein BS78_03G191200 [Paspalum vaginatum]
MAAISAAEKARALEQCEVDLTNVMDRMAFLSLGGGDEEEEGGAGAVPSDSGAGAGAGLIDVFVMHLAGSLTMDDATARAAGFLQAFGASVAAASRAERDAAQRQNATLKKAFLVLHAQHKAAKAANGELLRQLEECQGRMRTLEMDNYALSTYLKRTLPQGGSTMGRFLPEVF